MPLTDTQIKKAKPATKVQRLFDGEGLYLEVPPSGRKRWRLKYRIEGREKRISLGAYPDVSLKAARDRKTDARRPIAAGLDPSEQRKAEKASSEQASANSFESIAREWFAKRSPGWAASHADRIVRR